ncbi:hypothetical protein K457DRAFT_805349 [Linnemannia elongata AG-77]|uniref:Uncharacterized protein n=1 Tax=Linnemannia elongata AG-77 TaxID=1314771 RepID=A0A197JHY2_9FUNG|nr:hypothetical protein K457DRAFT_805349 [Linnemannia elongata AG-77]
MDTDKVSAAMGNYMLQGWAMLNDGCPDCNVSCLNNNDSGFAASFGSSAFRSVVSLDTKKGLERLTFFCVSVSGCCFSFILAYLLVASLRVRVLSKKSGVEVK